MRLTFGVRLFRVMVRSQLIEYEFIGDYDFITKIISIFFSVLFAIWILSWHVKLKFIFVMTISNLFSNLSNTKISALPGVGMGQGWGGGGVVDVGQGRSDPDPC